VYSSTGFNAARSAAQSLPISAGVLSGDRFRGSRPYRRSRQTSSRGAEHSSAAALRRASWSRRAIDLPTPEHRRASSGGHGATRGLPGLSSDCACCSPTSLSAAAVSTSSPASSSPGTSTVTRKPNASTMTRTTRPPGPIRGIRDFGGKTIHESVAPLLCRGCRWSNRCRAVGSVQGLEKETDGGISIIRTFCEQAVDDRLVAAQVLRQAGDRCRPVGIEQVGQRLPAKGRVPVNISKSTTPRLYRSPRASGSWPAICSGHT